MADARPAHLPSTACDDGGKLLLRLVIGVLILLHGVFKLTHGVGGIGGMLQGLGVPAVAAYGVYVGEVIAPLLLIVGLWTRPAALVIAINMVVAIALAHRQQLTSLTEQGGWALELQGLYLFGALAVMLLGAGRYRLAKPGSRWD